ncbi:MAG: hypothetical protein JWP11_2820 [Frankiales bacterium]|nr:hypothetical protein [Frankiales bacterium]
MLLPVVALAALSATSPQPAELVSRGSGPLHLYASRRALLRDFTRSGVLRAGRRPVCAQPCRRWYLAAVDGRPLCGRCSRWARARLDLTAAPVTAAQLLDVLLFATSTAEVDAVQSAALAAGLVTARVAHPDPKYKRVPLHTVIAHTRSRLTPARVGLAEHSWLQRALAPRYPRRIA